MKTKILMTALVITSVVLMAACKNDDFVQVVGVCPVVVSTSPVNLATNVPLSKVVTVTFNEKMNAETITETSFIVQGAAPIAGTIAYTDSTASFSPSSPLTANTTYTGKVTTSVRDEMGNALQEDYVWTFSTGALLSPTVISTNPVNNATNVPFNKIIKATFSVPMNPLTINDTTFTIKRGATSVVGTISYTGSTATFTPTSTLLPNTVYTGTITTFAKNVPGTALANNYVFTFSTGTSPIAISTDPVNSATNVPLNKVVSVNFSVAMDPATINSSTYTLKAGATSIPGVVNYTSALKALGKSDADNQAAAFSSVATFTPSSPLVLGTTYTATITTGAKNVPGIGLSSNHVWNFSTGAVVTPTVISTDPLNLATNIALSKIISATFNVPMDPATITTSTFTLKLGLTTVLGTVNYSGSTATFTPSSVLLADTTYTATITTGAKNVPGTPLTSNKVWTFSTVPHLGPAHVDMKLLDGFGIIAGVGISNNAGFSEIHDMDVGIYPGVRSSITGFFDVDGGPGQIINGTFFAAGDLTPPGVDAMLIQAKQDLLDAYDFCALATVPAPATVAGDLGGQTLAPGIYKSTSTLSVSTDLTLDGQGDVNAVWIFQIASDFTTFTGGNIVLIGGAQAKNVFWQIGSSATVGDNTAFKGNILALSSITMNSGATAVGRMLARNAAVTLTSTNIITKP